MDAKHLNTKHGGNAEMGNSGVIFKATNNGLVLILNQELEFDTIYNEINMKLASAGRFFKGASLTVKYRGRSLANEEIKIISDLMSEKTNATINSFEEDNTKETDSNTTVETEDEISASDGTDQVNTGDNRNRVVEEGVTKFYKGTVRSGRLLNFDGNIVILGDVNPGAEIQASGNIIVMGCLRGTVHAGMYGDDKATVASINLQPVQLRIANIITRPPDEQNLKEPVVPEIAFIKDDMIYIERLLPQR